MRNTVDLNKCRKGDLLISRHGSKLRYVRPLPFGSYYDHEVEYIDGSRGSGTRTNDGYVFRNEGSRLESDEDIILVIENQFTIDESKLIVDALNAYYFDAVNKVIANNLDDIELNKYNYQRDMSLSIMNKLK